MKEVRTALISLSDKRNLADLGRRLSDLGIEILSTGNSAKLLKDANVSVIDISSYTGFPESLDGRVKTLHPKVHGGILAVRENRLHIEFVNEFDIKLIDLVIVNLYPFRDIISKEGSIFEDAIENIDIGGPAMIRSAAKNHKDVAVVVDPSDYEKVLRELERENKSLKDETRRQLALKAFECTSSYDQMIADYLRKAFDKDEADKSEGEYSRKRVVSLDPVQVLRYGENPHQAAGYYRVSGSLSSLADAKQLNGKELSYNNIVDMNAAYDLVSEFNEPACAIIKHTNPSGCAIGKDLLEAYLRARETDPVSAFGGVVGFNRKVDLDTANEVSKLFLEIVIAPDYDPAALEVLRSKKNLRVMQHGLRKIREGEETIKIFNGVALIQDEDRILIADDFSVVTKRHPSEEEMEGLVFAMKVAKHVKSNAIVYADRYSTIAVGAGQMSRIDSAKIAASKARRSLSSAVMASDAFFPFADSIDMAKDVGVKAIIQPGGSIKDLEVIKAADKYDISMIFSKIRHFRH